MRVVVARGVLALGSLVGCLFALNAWLDSGERAWVTAALGTVTGLLVFGLAALARSAGWVSWRWLVLPCAVAALSWGRWLGVVYR